MMAFTKRQKEIIFLLKEIDDFVPAEWVAKQLGVSDRTVRKEIKFIQQKEEFYGIHLESIRGKGYKLIVTDKELFLNKVCQSQEEEKNELSGDFSVQDNRVIYILKRLLLEKKFIKLQSLEEEMFVSKSTLQNDLKIVKEILEKYNLIMVNRPHYGTKVEGDEYMKRLCLSNSILSRNSGFKIDHDSFYFLNKDLFETIKKIIIKKVNEYKIDISDISLENLATHITIACKRIEKGFVIEKLNKPIKKHYPFEKIVANEIVKEVEEYTGLTFPESEIDYIIVHLLGTKLLHKEELTEYGEFDEASSIVECMLERLRMNFNWDFRGDMEFIQALTLHIRPAMNRLRFKMNIRNPLLNEIKVKYPIAFEGAVIASKCIENYLNIEVGEHEIAYLSLHIGVALERMNARKRKVKKAIIVCASGVGSAKLLFYRIKNKFDNKLEIVDTINYYNLASYDLQFVDLIISTVPIREDLGVPVLVVSTFLDDQDIKNIKGHLSMQQVDEQSYLHPSRVFIHKEFKDKESVIRFLCDEIYKQGLVSKDYVNLVLERESLAPTNFGNLVAIPHPITPKTKETFWTVCTLKRPIHWNNNDMVQFVCLLNIKEDFKGDLERMYQKLIAIIEDKTIVQKLIKSQSVEEIIEILK